MKLNSDSLATIFGAAAGLSTVLGQTGVLSTSTAGVISSIFVALLGLVSNKSSVSIPPSSTK